jgi:hypothetical protein
MASGDNIEGLRHPKLGKHASELGDRPSKASESTLGQVGFLTRAIITVRLELASACMACTLAANTRH